MATLVLTQLWVNLLSSGAGVSAWSADRSVAYETVGEVKQLAGGRQRAYTVVGEQGSYPFTLLDVTAATVTTLRSWAGQVVQVRDNRSQVFVGIYLTVGVTERPDTPTLYNAQLQLRTVTVPAGV